MSGKVLLVEDDPFLQDIVKTALDEAGFHVETSATAADGILTFSQNAPELVIMDINLPDGNGMDLCKTLGLGLTVDTPFIFLSARDDLKMRLAAFAAGAHDFIQKPFSLEELVARVKVQFQIKKLHDDLSRKNYELEVMNRARQDVTSMIVHDLKTPLATIMGMLDVVKAREQRGLPVEGNPTRLLDSVGFAANFMLLMVNDLLDIGRAETTGLTTKLAPIDLDPFFDKLRQLFSLKLERTRITLEVRVDPDVRNVTSDHVLLFRILVNLIANALKISRSGTAVEIRVSREGNDARFVVLDRGPGIPDAMKMAIFEKYSTSQPKSLSEDGGTGIGLTFCRLAVRSLGGRIWAEDRPGGGSAFVLLLPEPVGAGTKAPPRADEERLSGA
jgi:signal transduction histidine kinase